MKKKELLKILENIKDDAEVLINIGNNIKDIRLSGKYRGSFIGSDFNNILINFDRYKK